MAMYESAWQRLIPITRIELVAGLSCCADEDLHRLSQWAAEGWQVVAVRRMCVVLERTSPARVEFALDYQCNPDDEYFELCRMAGWTHVVSLSQSIHLFNAPSGTRSMFSAHDTTMVLRAQQQLHRAVLLRGLALIIGLWIVTALVWPWSAAHVDGLLAWVLVGSGFVSMYALMVMVWYTALPWVVYQMCLYGVNIRGSRRGARMCVDGLSILTGALCGWMVA